MMPAVHQIALESQSRGAARLVLFAIALEADAAGVCTASTKRLAALAGIQRNHVSRATQQLVAAGEVAVEHMVGAGRRNIYRLLCSQRLACGLSQGGEDQKPAPQQPSFLPEPSEHPLEAIHRLRAEAWAVFDPHGRPWHHANDAEREAFADSEQGRVFLSAVAELAAAAGVRVAPTGDVVEPGS